MKEYKAYLDIDECRGIEFFVQKVKRLAGKDLLQIRLFGSKIRGDFADFPDLDLLVVLRKKDIKVYQAISKIAAHSNLKYNCVLSPIIYSLKEYEKNRAFKTPFIQNIEREGVSL